MHTNGLVVGGMDGNVAFLQRKAPKEELLSQYPYHMTHRLHAVQANGTRCTTVRCISVSPSESNLSIVFGSNIGSYDFLKAAPQDERTLDIGAPLHLNYLLKGGNFHIQGITEISACAQRPFIASLSSDDQTVKVI